MRIPWASALLLVAACQRPIEGRQLGRTVLTNLQVEPSSIRAGVPIRVSFRVNGPFPEKVTVEIGGRARECEPTREGSRLTCEHPALIRGELAQGTINLVVRGSLSEGESTSVTTQVVVDFDCPRLIGFSVVPPIASPGDEIVVLVETSEPLSSAPQIFRGGRNFGVATGSATSWRIGHTASQGDPQTRSPLTALISDLAGNTNLDCGHTPERDFAIDFIEPVINTSSVVLLRGASGLASSVRAGANSFVDDVGLREVRVLDETGSKVIARLFPEEDGSLPTTSIGAQPSTRVLLEAIDLFGRSSGVVSIREEWRLSIGDGSTPNAAVNVASRFSPAPPETSSMTNRTSLSAPELLSRDARFTSVRTRITFEDVGTLPTRYEDTSNIIAGYEPVGRRIIAVGGYRGRNEFSTLFANYVDDMQVIGWDPFLGEYVAEEGPSLVIGERGADASEPIPGPTPGPRFGVNMAFDGGGCGVLFSGSVLFREQGTTRLNDNVLTMGDAWQLCHTPSGYQWQFIPVPNRINDEFNGRFAPIAYDPVAGRYMITGGNSRSPEVVFLEPNATPALWQWNVVAPLPTTLSRRSSHFLFYDPRLPGFSLGLGFAQFVVGGEARQIWSFARNEWLLAELDFTQAFRARYGFAFDSAREQLVVWGGSTDDVGDPADPNVNLMTRTATHGISAWRTALLDNPLPRDYPALVYDSDREVTLVFGGVRYQDTRAIAPTIHQMILAPSAPHLQAVIDLAATRPKGIEQLTLEIRANGSGDGDGLGPANNAAGGFVVMLWDHEAERWVEVERRSHPLGEMTSVSVNVTSEAERFVSPKGTLPITIMSLFPATESLSARLDVDLIDGSLSLRDGVTLP